MATPNLAIIPQRPGTVTASTPTVPMAEDAALLEKRRDLAAIMAAQARWLPKMTWSNYSA